MKAKIVYLNLGVDLLWGKGNLHENVFPMRSPFLPRLARSFENLGLYWADSEDSLVISKERLPESFLSVLSSYGVMRPQFLCIDVDPIEKAKFVSELSSQLRFLFLDWLEERSLKTSVVADDPLTLARQFFLSFLAASISEVEEVLARRTGLVVEHPHFAGSISEIVHWNEKKFLVQWCEEQSVRFPETAVVAARDLKNERVKRSGVWIAKPNLSSGGAGAWVINDPRDVILGRLDAFAQRPNITSDVWLLQKYYSRAKDWAIIGELSSSSGSVRLEPMQAVEVRYDRSRYSYAHLFSTKFSGSREHEQELQRVYEKIGDLLRQNGYQGCFGFDAFLSESGEFFPIVDLNVRLTKTHLLKTALQKVLKKETGQVLRWRAVSTRAPRFSTFWSALQDEFAEYKTTDFAPILISGFSASESVSEKVSETGPVEIHLAFAAENAAEAASSELLDDEFYQRVTRAFEASLQREES